MQAAADKVAQSFHTDAHITALRFNPARAALAVGASRLTGNVWSGSFCVLGDKAQLQFRTEVDHGCSALAWFGKTADRLLVATDDGVTRLWLLQGDKATMARDFDGHDDVITSISVEPREPSRIATSSYDRTVKIWTAEGSKSELPETVLEGHIDYVTAVDWKPGTASGILASSSWDSTVRLWDLRAKDSKTSAIVSTSAKVLCLGWGGEFHLYYGTEQGCVAVLDARNLAAPALTAHEAQDMPVRALAVNPHDAEQFAVAGDNGLATVYTSKGDRLYSHHGHADFVNAVSWSHTNPGQLASGGFDNTVHWWSGA